MHYAKCIILFDRSISFFSQRLNYCLTTCYTKCYTTFITFEVISVSFTSYVIDIFI